MGNKGKKWTVILQYFFIFIVCIITDLPMINMIGTSLKPSAEVLVNTNIFPNNPTVRNFITVITKTDFLHSVKNTIYISVFVVFFCTFFASMGGFAISRARGRVFSAYTLTLLILQMIPAVLVMIPLFKVLYSLKLSNTYSALILIYIAVNLPFGVLTMKGFFDNIPKELDEAAMIDGANGYNIYWRITLPSALPGMVSVAIYTLMTVWNEFTIANIFITSAELQTLSVSLRQFQLKNTTDWGALSAAATIACIPAFLFLVIAQKYLIAGLTNGAVKG